MPRPYIMETIVGSVAVRDLIDESGRLVGIAFPCPGCHVLVEVREDRSFDVNPVQFDRVYCFGWCGWTGECHDGVLTSIQY